MTAIRGPNTVKRFCSNNVLVNFTFGQNTIGYQITRVKGQNVNDQIAFCAFHSCLVEFQTNAGYRHAVHV